MIYTKATVENGQIKFKNAKIINQNNLTSDCWMLQFEGLKACETCEFKDTKECGGGETLKQLKKS